MAKLSIGVGGTDGWSAVSAALGDAGTDIPDNVSSLIRKKAAEIVKAAQAAILAEPVHGRKQSGLRALIADSVSATDIDGGSSISASMDGDKANLPYDTDAGTWEHPVFGGHTWVTQIDAPGWFSDTADTLTDGMEDDVAQVIDDAVDKIAAS